MTSRYRRQFTPEFKAEAVALVEAAGGNISQVAKELKIYDSSLGNWVRQAREEASGAPSVEERTEIAAPEHRARVGSTGGTIDDPARCEREVATIRATCLLACMDGT